MPQDVTEAPRSTLQVWLLALGMFAIGTDLFVVSGLLPLLGHSLGLSTAAAGQTVTAFALTYAVAAPLLASVTSRIDRKPLLLTVMVVFAVGNVLSATATSYALLLLGRVVAGSAAALYAATASAVASRITSTQRRGRALGIVYAGMTSAIALGVPIGNIIGSQLSWRWAFGFVALLTMIALVGLGISLPHVPGAPAATVRQRLGAIRIPHAPTALATTALWIVGTFIVYTYLGSLLHQVTHTTAAQKAWLLLLFGAGSFAGVMAGGWLADRVRPVRALTASMSLLAVTLAVLDVALRSLPGAAVGLAIWGLVHWVSFPLIQHRLITIGGKNSDMLLALNNSAVYIGQTIAAVVGGLLVSAGGLRWLPLAGTGFEALALATLAVRPAMTAIANAPESWAGEPRDL